jgi:signal transduction histidine kinase
VEYPQENTLSKEQLMDILKIAKHNSERQIITAETIEAAGVPGFTVGFLINRDTFKGLLLIGQRLSGRVIYDDERANLAKISNEIGLALENTLQYTKIQQFNSELQFKIDDATRQLKRSNEKLKALDEAKDDFVSMASHQLRTPLTSVKGYLSMVLEGDAGELNEQQRSMLDQAFTSSQRMTYLIADLLNLSRLKTGKFVIENIPTDLAKVITQELSQVEATAEARKLTITYQEPESFPTLLLDQTKIRQVIMNFVDNAIYYTPAGGEITVKVEELEKSIEFTVHDTGIGVPAADQHNLFSKFYRAANAKQARPDGTGLGLFMARKVIVAQGGATIFRSQVGKGSMFGFSFPKTLVTKEAPKIT